MNYKHILYKIGFCVLLPLILIMIANICKAQQVSLKTFQNKYPGEAKIFLNCKRDVKIDLLNDSLKITMRNHEESLYMQKNSLTQANQSVTFSDDYKITSLQAETHLPKSLGNKIIKVNSFDTSDYRDPMVFFDDVKSINFSFPQLEEGAVTLLDYTYTLKEPRNLGCFYFNNFIPINYAEIKVTCPSEVILGYKLFNCDSLQLEFTHKNVGNKTEYCWKAKNIPKLIPEDNSPSYFYYAAHMFVYIKEYTIGNKKVTILSDEKDLHKWYHQLISSVNITYTPALKLLVDSITKNADGELDKVKKITFWVQDHIKYIAFEAGRDGYIPRNADDVYNKRYGDCKDMASLINKMLELAGIESHFTWVGTRNIPYNYQDLPLPLTDNHMVATYKNGNQYFFLDATTGPHPFNYPPYAIQGKEALIDLGPDNFEIVKVPEVDSKFNVITDTLLIQIDGKKITGHGVSYFKGYERFEMYNYLVYKDPPEQLKFLKNFFEKGNNKFLIDNYKIMNLDQRDEDLIVSYNFNINDYTQVIGDEIFLNMNLDKLNMGSPVKSSRKTDIEANYKKKIVNEVILKIPKGYKISYLPENSECNDELFGFKIFYKSNENEVRLTREIYMNYLLLKPSKTKDWNNMLDSLNVANKSSIILTKDKISDEVMK